MIGLFALIQAFSFYQFKAKWLMVLAILIAGKAFFMKSQQPWNIIGALAAICLIIYTLT